MYYLFPLCAVTAVMWVPVTYAKWDDYNPGSGGIDVASELRLSGLRHRQPTHYGGAVRQSLHRHSWV